MKISLVKDLFLFFLFLLALILHYNGSHDVDLAVNMQLNGVDCNLIQCADYSDLYLKGMMLMDMSTIVFILLFTMYFIGKRNDNFI